MKKTTDSISGFFPLERYEDQLPLPLFASSATVLFDECWAPSDLVTTLTQRGIRTTTVPKLGLRGSGDAELRVCVLGEGDVMVTADYDYLRELLVSGVSPSTTVFVDQKAPADGDDFVELLARMTNTLRTAPGRELFAFYMDSGKHIIVELDLPPCEVLVLFKELRMRREGLATKDLARIWGCKRSCAGKRAQKLASQGWLRRVPDGKRYLYLMGPKLHDLVGLPRRLRMKIFKQGQ
ncbi:MAG: hypothetical protein N2320_06540 [Candidatus Bipolaricaulota bacterium]|nr:hypothetical protein [Candidatus Bipolaricaulota bacterium]